jgi:hypothetical protein
LAALISLAFVSAPRFLSISSICQMSEGSLGAKKRRINETAENNELITAPTGPAAADRPAKVVVRLAQMSITAAPPTMTSGGVFRNAAIDSSVPLVMPGSPLAKDF